MCLGLSRIASLYSNIVYDGIEYYLDKLINNGVDNSYELIIGSRLIQWGIKGYNDDFLDYPVQRIRILLWLKNKKVFRGCGYDVTGAMYSFGSKSDGISYITDKYNVNYNKTIISDISLVCDVRMELGVYLDVKKYSSDNISSLKLELMTVIMHELNHGYEYWLRYQNKKVDNINVSISYLDFGSKHFTKKVYKKLTKFLFFMYWSLSHERNAKIQEFYPLVLKYDPKELVQQYTFSDIMDMINFNAEKFHKELEDLIPKRDLDKIKRKALKRFKENFKETHKQNDEIVDETVLRKESLLDIFKYYEKGIKTSGEIMRRKILRLYSLKMDLHK